MPLSLALDLGTTTITALAVDVSSGDIVARQTVANDAEITSSEHKARGRSEWDANRIAAAAKQALRTLAHALGRRVGEVAGIGLTGQQHGAVLIDDEFTPLGPLINWQDRRAEETKPHTGVIWLNEIRSRVGDEARERAGCTLSSGYMGATLYWLAHQDMLPRRARACFLVDFLAAVMTRTAPLTDPTSAASSGLFDVRASAWDERTIEALGLSSTLFPSVGRAGERQGSLHSSWAAKTGLVAGLPVCVGLGDNQASVYGSVADLPDTVLVNVGTGGQVTAWSDRFLYSRNLETRPFPGGYLIVNAGLCGGRTYAVLERFFQQTCQAFGQTLPEAQLYDVMNRLAAAVPPGAAGLRCEPLFTGTRQQPDLRGRFTGISIDNFTPGHVTRALLEGMGAVFEGGYQEIVAALGAGRSRLVGAGNGLRQNGVFCDIVSRAFGMPMRLCRHAEEAAFGAALVAAVGLGLLPDRQAAARLIR
ncbi:MAG TPA: FGGY family carbohydrate kinase [Pirellulales bacterium]|nr:FGGY family carbohydrate kinase [Pirellulales bacterium]